MGVTLKIGADGVYDLDLNSEGKMQRADTTLQEVELLLQLNQGQLKYAPLLGPNLLQKKNSNATESEIRNIVKLHLQMDNKNYDDIKNLIALNS